MDKELYEVRLIPISFWKTELSATTLWGALCWAILFLFGEKRLQDFISETQSGNYLISSVMPFFEKDGEKKKIKRYYFKPLLKPADLENILEEEGIKEKEEKNRYIKKYKRTPFIPEDIF